MTFTYPAVFTEKEDGTGYHAFFPDLEMCEADGADLEDAIENASPELDQRRTGRIRGRPAFRDSCRRY